MRHFNTCLLVLCILIALVFCGRKQGLHEDEYYSFYSTNRTDGFWVEDSVLMDRQTILNEFCVVPGEGFNFGLVKEVQSWDVHPPIYYFLLHFVCSVTPGKFSMWQGLIVNLIAFGVSLFLLKRLAGVLIPELPIIQTLAVVAWGVSAATLTGVVFIRMYMLLTVWIIVITLLHAKEYIRRSEATGENKKAEISFLVQLGVFTFLGFMTHYYFFIWLFFLAVVFNLADIVRTRKLWGVIKYAGVMVVTFGLCYVFYPAWPAQMFKGQRGAQATGNFIDISNTWSRIVFFAEKVNRIGFGGLLWIIILVFVIAVIVCKLKSKGASQTKQVITSQMKIVFGLIITGVCYFLVVSKTGLMLGDSSIRYQMPVLGVIYVALVGIAVGYCRDAIAQKCIYGALIVLIACNAIGAASGNVSFLYEEEAEHREILDGYSDATIMYAFDPDPTQTWCVWASTDELIRGDGVYFSAGDKTGEISDMDTEVIGSNDQIILYVDSAVDETEVMHKITAINPKISTLTPLFTHRFCEVYVCE